MRQTAAIFLDAYRELNSKKLFWVVLAISGLIVGIFACVGISERGLTFLHWELGFGPNTLIFSREFFYKQMLFVAFGIKFWLAFLGTILALISTASIFPDFLAGGSIDLVLSRPITRVRLFFTKYAAGLLFVALQIGLFTFAVFLILGLRAGKWEPRLFLAIPLVVAFFSYIFSICVLLGMLTRSTIASLLLTLLIWAACFLIYTADTVAKAAVVFNNERASLLSTRIERTEKDIADLTAKQEKGLDAVVTGSFKLPTAKTRLESLKKKQAESKSWTTRLGWVSMGMHGVYAVLPKMAETKDLLERALLSEEDRRKILREDDDDVGRMDSDDPDAPVDGRKVQRKVLEDKLSQPAWWILGTSLGFEAVILGFACWIFCRRDF